MGYENMKQKFIALTLESEDHWDYKGKAKSEKDYVHDLCTYPAMMVPKMQREMLDVYLEGTTKKDVFILDPFAGAGTILVESMLRGLHVVGVDINPLAILLCKAKTTIIDPHLLSDRSENLLSEVMTAERTEPYKFDGIEKWFTDKAIIDLSILKEHIEQEPSIELRRFYWAAFCEVVRIVSNSRECTYKLHIKTQEDIASYNKNARQLFCTTLKNNVKHYEMFYHKLQSKNLLSEDGHKYKGSVNIILGDCIDYLTTTESKFDVVFTSPPYGDNHTTVSYGQYSILPLRWMNVKDIDDHVNEELLKTQCGIDTISLGGRHKVTEDMLKDIVKKSLTLDEQVKTIQRLAPKQVAKIVSFYHDFDKFLAALSRHLNSDSVSVWTVGNRRVAKQEIHMDEILVELEEQYGFQLLTSFTRKIPKKRLPEIEAYSGTDKGTQGTMTCEHILIFSGGKKNGGKADDAV